MKRLLLVLASFVVVLSAAQTAFAGVGTSPSKHRAGFGSSPGLLLPATRHHRFAA